MGRLGAWLGVLALLASLVAPLPQAQAADWAAEGLFPPTCSVHADDQGQASLPSQQACSQCPLCQLSLGERLLPVPVAAPGVAVVSVATACLPPELRHAPWPPSAAHPPLPSRGPPAAA